MSEGTDWAWCYENPKEAASLIDALEAERDAYKAQAKLLEHKVITCGVAASHSDANLAHTGAYAGKWDSPQAIQVRKLRAERDALRKSVDQLADTLKNVHEAVCETLGIEGDDALPELVADWVEENGLAALRKDNAESLRAMRRAVLALAAAVDIEPMFKPDYKLLSDSIAAIAAKEPK